MKTLEEVRKLNVRVVVFHGDNRPSPGHTRILAADPDGPTMRWYDFCGDCRTEAERARDENRRPGLL
jgi:hypothetical protein